MQPTLRLFPPIRDSILRVPLLAILPCKLLSIVSFRTRRTLSVRFTCAGFTVRLALRRSLTIDRQCMSRSLVVNRSVCGELEIVGDIVNERSFSVWSPLDAFYIFSKLC
uniref:Uncharacterized protein n=1 Tax=Cacopsylla melanoneura TaxID=428564 RepID=A0A8D9AX55_9HEMI